MVRGSVLLVRVESWTVIVFREDSTSVLDFFRDSMVVSLSLISKLADIRLRLIKSRDSIH